jgi:hypothetical protein
MSLLPFEKLILGLDVVPVPTHDRPRKLGFGPRKVSIASENEEACSITKGDRADLISFDGCGRRRGRRLIVTAAIFAFGIVVGLGGIALTAETLHQFQWRCSAAR